MDAAATDASPDDAGASEPGNEPATESATESAKLGNQGAHATNPARDGRTRASRWSRWLIVVASVLAVIATTSTWVRTELLDTDEWVRVSSDLLAEPEVQQAVTDHLANELFDHVDLAGDLQALLPDALGGLAGPLAGALREPITNAIGTMISSDRFAQLWENANRAAHERMVAILRDETRPGVSTADGTVTIEFGEVLRAVGERVGVSADTLARIPDDAGSVVIFESDELATVQGIVQILDFLSWFLFLAVVALYVAAIAVARDRRVAVRDVGVALVVVGIVLLLLRAAGLRFAAGAVVADRNESLALHVGQVATRLLAEAAWTSIVYGVLVAGSAALLGTSGPAREIRRLVGRATESVGAAIGLGVGAVLVMLWWSPGRSFDRPLNALVFVAVVVAAIATLVVVSRREYARARSVALSE